MPAGGLEAVDNAAAFGYPLGMAKTEIVKRHKSKRVRTKGLLVRLTVAELKQLHAFAAAQGLPLTTWARVELLRLQRGFGDITHPAPVKAKP
jgi:hypothetical protein